MNDLENLNDCFLNDKERLTHDDAIALLKSRLQPLTETEMLAVSDAQGRILAQQVSAPHNVPLHTNSAVDGYAFSHDALKNSPMEISMRIRAGDNSEERLPEGTAARIFTGASMPIGSDTVAMQEDCKVLSSGQVQIPTALKHGANCRLAGEDLKAGDVIIRPGKRLNAADLAAASSVGRYQLQAFKQVRIKIFSSGNELRLPTDDDASLKTGQVWDTNSPMLTALLKRLPVQLQIGGILPDNPEVIEKALLDAATHSDLVITTGGASRGDEDHMLNVLSKIGKRHLWQLAVKPGRPMMMGQIDKQDESPTLFMGLPGNPVAAMVCFLLYVRPSILTMAGEDWSNPIRFPVPARFEIKHKKPDRREFLRGLLVQDDAGNLSVEKFSRDGSGLITSLRESDGLIEIPEEVQSVKPGECVNFIPFNCFN